MVAKLVCELVVGDYILACDKPSVKGKVKSISVYREQYANPWSDTSNQNAANWAGALIRARSPLGSNRKQVISTLPPPPKEARAAASDVELTYLEGQKTVTIKTSMGTFSLAGNIECQVARQLTEAEALML